MKKTVIFKLFSNRKIARSKLFVMRNWVRRKYIIPLLTKMSPIIATKYIYRIKTGKKLNLKQPKDFNEKIQWLKLYWQNTLVVRCTDKYEVRNYVNECGCGNILNELYAVYNSIYEIDWDYLPQSFVMKTTNACGTNIICYDKETLNIDDTLAKLDRWMKTDYGLKLVEIHYSKIVPKIICEKYLFESSNLAMPVDYKIHCFNGVPKLIQVITERETGSKKVHNFDTSWHYLDLYKNKTDNYDVPARPISFNKMLTHAKILSKPFSYVRIDLYEINGAPVFGEMTFTPLAGLTTKYTEDALNMLGGWINLPVRSKNY